MQPDGHDVVEPALPTASVYPTLSNGETPCTLGFRDCTVQYEDPSWGPDGRIYFSSDLLMEQFDGPDWPSWEHGRRIFSSLPDGSDVQRITSPGADASYWPVNAFGQPLGNFDSGCPAVSPDGQHLAFVGNGSVNFPNVNHLWIVDRVGNGWSLPRSLVTTGPQPGMTLHPTFPSLLSPPSLSIVENEELSHGSCPRWSDDSTRVALVAEMSYVYAPPTGPSPRTGFDYSAVVVADLTGTMRVVSPMPTYIPGAGGYSNFLWQTDFFESVDWSGDDLLVSRGFENLLTFNPGGGLGSSPKFWGAFRLDPDDGALTRLTPEPDLWVDTRPNMFKVSPGGVPYGSLIQPSDVQCQSYESDLALILLQSGNTESVHADRPVGVCSVWDNQFDWAIVGQGGPGTSPPQLVPDPSSAPDDGNAPEEVDVATLTEPSSEPAEGADDIPPAALPSAAPIDVVVPADGSTTLTLLTTDGSLAPFQIDDQPPAAELTIAGLDEVAMVTGVDGEITVTPTPGFLGTTTFSYFVVGDPDHVATATVTVVGNAPPIAADDAVSVTAGTDTTFDPSVLLANDVDPDAAQAGRSAFAALAAAPSSLQLAAVFGSGNGRAWIDSSGMVHVAAAQAGNFTFSYIVADSGGATDGAVVQVAAAGVDPPATTTTTTTTPSTPTTPTTSSPTPQTPTTTPGTTPTNDHARPQPACQDLADSCPRQGAVPAGCSRPPQSW